MPERKADEVQGVKLPLSVCLQNAFSKIQLWQPLKELASAVSNIEVEEETIMDQNEDHADNQFMDSQMEAKLNEMSHRKVEVQQRFHHNQIQAGSWERILLLFERIPAKIGQQHGLSFKYFLQNLNNIEIEQEQLDIGKQSRNQEEIDQSKQRQTEYLIQQKKQEQQLKKQLVSKTMNILERHSQSTIKETYNKFRYPNADRDDYPMNRTYSRKNNSASSKRRSENSQDLNFDLTYQSKNLFHLQKQDSLMYSNATGFGVAVERSFSPPKKKMSDEQDAVKEPEKERKSENQASKISLKMIEDEGNPAEQPSSIVSIGKSESKIINSIPFDPTKSEQEHRSRVEQPEQSITEEIHRDPSVQDYRSELGGHHINIAESATFQKQKLHPFPRKRIDTQFDRPTKRKSESRNSSKKFNRLDHSRLSESNSNVFSTEINSYQLRIAKIKESKLHKKKKLQDELAKINFEIDIINKQEEDGSPMNERQFANRVEISDDHEALVKAESLVRNLRTQKRQREMAKLGEFKSLDKNISDYMVELSKLREENQNKLKQRKKLEILDRMKQKELQKANDRKKKDESVSFVLQLKNPRQSYDEVSRVTPTKRTQMFEDGFTPELSHKKVLLKKVRNIPFKKSKAEAYEQLLS